jgi:hypothetical protein
MCGRAPAEVSRLLKYCHYNHPIYYRSQPPRCPHDDPPPLPRKALWVATPQGTMLQTRRTADYCIARCKAEAHALTAASQMQDARCKMQVQLFFLEYQDARMSGCITYHQQHGRRIAPRSAFCQADWQVLLSTPVAQMLLRATYMPHVPTT